MVLQMRQQTLKRKGKVFFIFNFMSMGGSPPFVSALCECLVPTEAGRGSYRWSCELPCGCGELNLDPLKEQTVLLSAEPSPQPGKADA